MNQGGAEAIPFALGFEASVGSTATVGRRGVTTWHLEVEGVTGQRGAGDISFVAAHLDGLDGIGARGSGSHTPDEQLDLASLPELIKRTAILIDRLTR